MDRKSKVPYVRFLMSVMDIQEFCFRIILVRLKSDVDPKFPRQSRSSQSRPGSIGFIEVSQQDFIVVVRSSKRPEWVYSIKVSTERASQERAPWWEPAASHSIMSYFHCQVRGDRRGRRTAVTAGGKLVSPEIFGQQNQICSANILGKVFGAKFDQQKSGFGKQNKFFGQQIHLVCKQ